MRILVEVWLLRVRKWKRYGFLLKGEWVNCVDRLYDGILYGSENIGLVFYGIVWMN